MAGKSKPWFRVYSEIRNDRKIKRLTAEERWVWIVLLSLASDSPERGKLLFAEDMPYTCEEIADEADVELEVLNTFLSKIEKMNMIYWEDDVLVVAHFLDRQYDNPSDRPDKTKERKQRSRQHELSAAIEAQQTEVALFQANSEENEETLTAINEKESDKHVTSVNIEQLEEVTSMSRICHETYTESETESETKIKDSSQHAAATTTAQNLPAKFFSEESQEYKLALFLRGLILKNMPEARVPQANTKAKGLVRWCKDIDYILRVDGRSAEDVRSLMFFCQNDEFWRSNILSPRKLREKWETLWMQMQVKYAKKGGDVNEYGNRIFGGNQKTTPRKGKYTQAVEARGGL